MFQMQHVFKVKLLSFKNPKFFMLEIYDHKNG